MGYFALAETPSVLEKLDEWLRRRLRACLWKQWKRVRTRYHKLRALGLPERVVGFMANTRKGPWRIAASPPLQQGLNKAYWAGAGAGEPAGALSLDTEHLANRRMRTRTSGGVRGGWGDPTLLLDLLRENCPDRRFRAHPRVVLDWVPSGNCPSLY